jgi:hypothetical protein
VPQGCTIESTQLNGEIVTHADTPPTYKLMDGPTSHQAAHAMRRHDDHAFLPWRRGNYPTPIS